jgi:MYXO-CTERM domain-containing protein
MTALSTRRLKMNTRRTIAAVAVILSCAPASAAVAQGRSPTTTEALQDDDDGDYTGLWGLVGAAGVAGLVALRRRGDITPVVRASRPDVAGGSTARRP